MKAKKGGFKLKAMIIMKLILLFCFLPGCTLYTIRAPEGMTVDRAKKIIYDYEDSTRGYITSTCSDVPETDVTDEYFTHFYYSVTSQHLLSSSAFISETEYTYKWEMKKIRFSDLGEFRVKYNFLFSLVATILTAGIIGPIVCEIEDTEGKVGVQDYNAQYTVGIGFRGRTAPIKVRWTHIIPIWIFGTPFWTSGVEEEYCEALAYMKKVATKKGSN